MEIDCGPARRAPVCIFSIDMYICVSFLNMSTIFGRQPETSYFFRAVPSPSVKVFAIGILFSYWFRLFVRFSPPSGPEFFETVSNSHMLIRYSRGGNMVSNSILHSHFRVRNMYKLSRAWMFLFFPRVIEENQWKAKEITGNIKKQIGKSMNSTGSFLT